MKFLVIFALVLATVSAFELRSHKPVPRERSMPVLPTFHEGRITNGNDANEAQFPHQVGLSLKHSVLSTSWCGGSLISDEWVLTAAHCTEGVKSVTAYLGATKRNRPQVKHTVDAKNIIIHEGWNTKTLRNDISLIRIPKVAFSESIQPVALPSSAKTYESYAGESAIASGWGRTMDGSNAVASHLQWGLVNIIANSQCSAVYGTNSVSATNICISTKDGVSTCQGDSGGPLTLESNNVQVGLTSYGAAAGCEKGYPAVFTRISSFLDWIEKHTGIFT